MPETNQGLVENPHSAGAPESLGVAPEIEVEAHVHESPDTGPRGGELPNGRSSVTDRWVLTEEGRPEHF